MEVLLRVLGQDLQDGTGFTGFEFWILLILFNLANPVHYYHRLLTISESFQLLHEQLDATARGAEVHFQRCLAH